MSLQPCPRRHHYQQVRRWEQLQQLMTLRAVAAPLGATALAAAATEAAVGLAVAAEGAHWVEQVHTLDRLHYSVAWRQAPPPPSAASFGAQPQHLTTTLCQRVRRSLLAPPPLPPQVTTRTRQSLCTRLPVASARSKGHNRRQWSSKSLIMRIHRVPSARVLRLRVCRTALCGGGGTMCGGGMEIKRRTSLRHPFAGAACDKTACVSLFALLCRPCVRAHEEMRVVRRPRCAGTAAQHWPNPHPAAVVTHGGHAPQVHREGTSFSAQAFH